MKIYLKNFKCWNKKIVELDKDGIQLLVGESGKGKSSVMDAIYFCLYGELQKIISHGEKSCEVKIEYPNLVITRTRRPNRLTVDVGSDMYEDEVAQEYINDKFGNYFIQTSYIKQNSYDNFIYMSPSEKLLFLEESILKKYKVDILKNKVQSRIKKLDNEIVELTCQYNTYIDIFSSIKLPEKVDFPIKCTEKNREVVIKNERVKSTNLQILIKKLNRKISACRETQNLLINLNNKIVNISENIVELDGVELEYRNKIEKLGYVDKNRCSEIDVLIKSIDRFDKYQKIKKDLDREETFYASKLQEEIENSRNRIKNVDEDEIVDLECKIDKIKNNLKYIPLIKDLKTLISKIPTIKDKYNKREIIDDLSKQNIELTHKLDLLNKALVCPCCNNKLIYSNSILEKYSGKTESTKDLVDLISKNNKKIEKIKQTVKNYELFEKYSAQLKTYECQISDVDVDSMETYKTRCCQIQNDTAENKKLKKLLETNKFPSLERSVDIIDKLKSKLDGYRNVEQIDVDKDKLLEELNNIKVNVKLYEDYSERLEKTIIKISKLKVELTALNQQKEDMGHEKDDIEVLEKQLDDHQRELSCVNRNIEQIEKWVRYTDEFNKYCEVENKTISLKKLLDERREELKICDILKTNIVQAETIAVKQFIDTINCQVQSYLDKFFKSDQLLVKLDTEKQLKGKKTTKSQINLNMEYKGHSIDIGNLSGGEVSRLNLAFVLALSEIFQSPILMLDECISTLDPDNCVNVLETVKEQYKGEIVLMVHHQITEGLFDKVVVL